MTKCDFHLIVVTDRKLRGIHSPEKFIERCCRFGVRAVQLREKDLSAKDLLSTAIRIRQATKRFSARLLINERIDIALLCGANGVHFPENSLFPHQVRRFTQKMLLGRSVHTLSSAKDAFKKGFDYILCGPVFKTPSKIKFGRPLGLQMLKKICHNVKIPVFAIGGITPERAKKCINVGAHGVAVIREVYKSANLRSTIRQFEKALGSL